jgi:Aspartyl protease
MIAGIARAVLAVLGASCLASARADDLDVGTVLANVRAAVGYQRLASLPGSVLVTGSAMIAGESGDYRCSFTPAGSYREQNGGLIAASRGFDGQVCWEVDPTGMPRTMILEDREKNLIWMWIRTHRWLAADAPFRIALVPDATDASTVTLTLALDEATLEERLVIDRATWLPSSSTHECDGVKEQLTLADYVETLGFKLARTLVLEQRLRREYRLRSVIVSAVVPSESYALPAERPHDTRIDPEAKPELELMRARSGHLLVKPVVNGEERGWFLLDTGAAALVIDDKVADAAGMTAFGRASAVGVGGAVGARFRRGRSLRLGPLTMDDPMYGGIDLESLSTAIGTPIVGICGYDLFSRAVVEIDMERLRVSLFDRGKYELTRGNWQELEIVGRHPCVRCTFAGGEGLFRLDTGAAPDTVTFNALAVERMRLLEGRETRPAALRGVGGTLQVQTGTLGWFEIGGYRFLRPRVNFATGRQGAFAGSYLCGNIGGVFLAPFLLVLDYGRSRIALVPREKEPR